MDIENAALGDMEQVVSLWVSAGLTRPWNDANKDFQIALTNEQQTILIIKQAALVVGSVMVADDGHRGWLYYLAVDEAHRRTGLGASLVVAAEKWLKNRGQDRVRLMMRRENYAVKDFYVSLGYGDQDCDVLGRTIE
jgi:ribosomal protein S18 acetylase RimI-like enzyme